MNLDLTLLPLVSSYTGISFIYVNYRAGYGRLTINNHTKSGGHISGDGIVFTDLDKSRST